MITTVLTVLVAAMMIAIGVLINRMLAQQEEIRRLSRRVEKMEDQRKAIWPNTYGGVQQRPDWFLPILVDTFLRQRRYGKYR